MGVNGRNSDFIEGFYQRLTDFCYSYQETVFLLPTTFKLFGFSNIWLWAYLMKVIRETRR